MVYRVFVLGLAVLLGVTGSVSGKEIQVRTGKYLLTIDGGTGAGLRLTDLEARTPVVVSGNVWWSLHDLKGKFLEAAGVPITSARIAPGKKNTIELIWKNPEAEVRVELVLSDRDGLAMGVEVTNPRREAITEIYFPLEVSLDHRGYEELIVPDHIGTAISMDRWFAKGGSLGDGIPYPTAHSDLLVAKGKGIKPSVGFMCPHTEQYLTPSQFYFGKVGDYTSAYRHRFSTWISQGKTWRGPVIHILTAKNVFDVFGQYRRLVGLEKAATVREKLGDKFERTSKAVVLKYECAWHEGKAIKEFARLTKDLPGPLIFQPVEYWPVRFDDHYPDYFPINATLGTDEDFRKMVAQAHARGDLVMPFFSPAHWSLGSPSTKKVGDQVAARDIDGKPYIYDGRPNYGVNYYVTGWNPLVIEKAEENLEQFKSFGCDSAFADIVGNMNKGWDFNPRTPNPRAFFAGMIRLGEAMGKVLPMTTEGGDDVHSANFWGMFQFYLKVKYKFAGHQSWRTADGYDPRWAGMAKEKQTRLFPMTSGLAGGLSVIYTHNLGPAILEQEMLNDNLAMGMGLYMRFQEAKEPAGLEWLKYLSYLQRDVVQYYFGRPMRDFKYVVGYDDVSVTQWDGFELYINHTAKPVTVKINGKEQPLKKYEMLTVRDGKVQVIPTFEAWKKK